MISEQEVLLWCPKTFLGVKRKFIQRKPKGYKSEKYWAHFNFPIPYVCAALDISIQWWNWPPEVLILLLCSKPPHNFKLLIPRHFTLLSKQIREAKLSFAHRPRKQQQYRVPQKKLPFVVLFKSDHHVSTVGQFQMLFKLVGQNRWDIWNCFR